MILGRYFILLILVTTFAVAAVAQQARAIHLGYRVECLNEEREDLAERKRELRCDISALSQPARIAEEIGRLDVGLLDPVALSRTFASERPGDRARGQRVSAR